MASPSPLDDVVFRPRKKRKVYRQRTEEDKEVPSTEATPPPAAQSLNELIAQAGADTTTDELSIADILRSRKQRKAKEGMAFKAGGSTVRDDEAQLIVHEAAAIEAPRKFTAQTGFMTEAGNKHMMTYIDSELEKRRPGALSKPSTSERPGLRAFTSESSIQTSDEPNDQELRKGGVKHGKLAEIDLGEEVRLKNITMTQRTLAGEPEPPPKKAPKNLLGPDGKPWRRQAKKYQKSEESHARDRMVEDLIKENRLDIYEPPAPERKGISDDQAADDRVADEFRNSFLNAQSERQRQKVKHGPPTRDEKTGKVIEEPKGPKLGGSRSQRAAMRESLLKEAAEKKK